MIKDIITFLIETDWETQDAQDARDVYTEPGLVNLIKTNGREANWVYMRDRTWEIWSEVRDRETLILDTPKRPAGLGHKPSLVTPAEAMYDIVKGVIENLAGFTNLIFVLTPESQDDMIGAVHKLERDGILETGHRSGQALFARIVKARKLQMAEAIDPEAEDLKDVYAPDEERFTPDYIKSAMPIFFSRRTRKFHGTRKIYFYGNFLVTYDVKRMGGHGFGVGDWTYKRYNIYEFKKTDDSPQGTTIWRGQVSSLPEAKRMIKTRDFSSRERVGLPEA